MPDSWRSDVARMRNRWIVIVTVTLSLLFHIGLFVLFWKSNAGLGKHPPGEEPIFARMVSPSEVENQFQKGKMVTSPMPSNEKRPDRAKIISYKDNKVDKETHRKDLPINDIDRASGLNGAGRPGKPGKSGRQGKSGTGSEKKLTTSDLINSVSYSDLKVEEGNGGAGGRGNVSPFNPDVGEPGSAININTKSFKYMSYFAGIKEKIEWAWVYPQEAQHRGLQGTLTLTFTILRGGKLKEVKLVRSSGSRVLDQGAIQAVKDAADFAPMPASWDDEEITIVANFQYRLIGTKSVY